MRFDGRTFDASQDGPRLTTQQCVVKLLMGDGQWRTLAEIAIATGYPEASISARLRDLRKPRHGSLEVQRRRRADGGGTWEYRVTPPTRAQAATAAARA